MPISYEVFMKHADKVCKNVNDSVERHQILKGVKHFENGDAVVTDSHRLYLAKGVHDRQDESVLTYSGVKLIGSYPDIYRLIPMNDPVQSVQLAVEDLFEAADSIFSVGSLIEEKATLQFLDDTVRYDSTHVNYKRSFPVQFEVSCFVNAKYLLDVIKLFKATECSTVNVNFYGLMRPIKLTNEDESLIALILPIRKY